MSVNPSETLVLLQRIHTGDPKALGELVARDLPWVRAYVARVLGPQLRARTDAEDVVQEAMLAVLKDGQKFTISDMGQFRALIARIVENLLRMKHRYLHQQKRDIGKEQRLLSDTVLDLDASVTRPSQAAMRNETQAWLQLCLDLLEPKDREVILLRQWKDLSFVEIGQQLGLDQAAVRMRFERALARLAKLVKRVQLGGLAQVLEETKRG